MKSVLYGVYNALPVFVRKIIDSVIFVFLVKPFMSVVGFVKKDRRDLKKYLKILFFIYFVGFFVFSMLGVSFYFDGLHQSSAWLSLTTLYRLEFIVLSTMLAGFVFYGKNRFDLSEIKGGKNVSYNKKNV